VSRRIKDITVIKRVPNRETSHRGMLSNRPTPSMAVTISLGSVAAVEIEPPRRHHNTAAAQTTGTDYRPH